MDNKFIKLFEPLQIRNVTLKNRIVKVAQDLCYAEPDGFIGERIKGYYETLAKGGIGLITVEGSICDYPLGAKLLTNIRVDDDKFIPGLSELAGVIHRHDCPAFLQIFHAGPACNPQIGGLQPIAPSALDTPAAFCSTVAREMTVAEIREVVEKFAQAALRVKKAGFEGVEIHMTHYALVNAFLSRIQNKRQDEYGCQSLENRARFSIEIMQRTRELLGLDFVIGVRMNGKEWGHELGTTNEEAIEFAKMFEKAGADYLQVSAFGTGPFISCYCPLLVIYPEPTEIAKSFAKRIPSGALIPEAAAIKKAVSIPVSGVGRLDPEIGERILEEGKVDMVCFGQRLLADPELPKKLAEGREEDIRPCLGCSNCLHFLRMDQPVQCRMNAFLGNETEKVMKPAEQKKRIMVVGSGPAGLEAAKVAAERGHEVTIYDKEHNMGGLLTLAAMVKDSEVDDLTPALKYYKTQLKKLGVKVHLGKEVNVDLVNKLGPDVVVLATGGKAVAPNIPVTKGAHIVTTEQLKSRVKVLLRLLGPNLMNSLTKIFLPVGKRVVVIGGDLQGLETAEFLAKRGRQVTILEESEQIGEGMLSQWLDRFLAWMKVKNIHSFTGIKYEEITSRGVNITTNQGGRKTNEADTILFTTRYKKNNSLYQALEGKVSELYLIGDAKSDQSEYIIGAIHDGVRIGLTV